MLLPRILTAVVGIPLVIAAVHLGGLPYMAFVGMVIVMSLYEYWLVLWTGGKPVQKLPLVALGLMMAVTAMITASPLRPGETGNLLPFAVSLAIFGVTLWEVITPRRSIERLANTFLGIFLIPWTLAHLVNLRLLKPDGEYLTIMLFVTVWTCDTAAYFIGKAFGSRKLNPEVSPKKTWEGTIAGFITAVAVSVALKNIFIPASMPDLRAAILGAVAGIAGQISDLVESVIKRSSGVKDSSNLLPGHGGILDRFDSYLLLAPLYYYAVVLFK